MNQSLLKRVFLSEFAFWVLVALASLYFVAPFGQVIRNGFLPTLKEHVRLGMDLAGGTYLTLEVQTEKAVDAELVNRMQGIEDKLRRARKTLPTSKTVANETVALEFPTVQAANDALMMIRSDAGKDITVSSDGSTVKITLPSRMVQRIKEDAVARNIEVLEVRLNRIGVADIPIAPQGERNIIIELPDVSDPAQAKAMIGKAAQLELKLVDRVGHNADDLLYECDGDLPSDKEILPSREDREVYLVDKYTSITGKLLKNAQAALGGQSGAEPVVSFELSDEGGELFYELTSRNVGKRLAIVLDGVVLSAPSINEGIRNKGQISGRFTMPEARDLALLLKSGAFVAPVTFEEERQIGPLLGAESIRQGFVSCLVGLGLLFIFSLFYYKLSGVAAFIALVFNLLLILAGMSWLKATLTLPGIAGMVLTVGMAIDASILIYERIKEVLATGVPIGESVKQGFGGAMGVILDANITTFLVGLVLYHFGTGPIQGFAVTMMLGIIATLITGLFFLRSFFKFILNNFHVQKLSI